MGEIFTTHEKRRYHAAGWAESAWEIILMYVLKKKMYSPGSE